MIDVVKLVNEHKCIYDWADVISSYNGYTLKIRVLKDAMKFNGIPAIDWKLKPINSSLTYNGVRLPATAHQLQQIADKLSCMLLTPKVIDMIWLQADLQFDCITVVNSSIVANANITSVHEAIESKIIKNGGDNNKKLISCVGKYWCLINDLGYKGYIAGDHVACNYGWFSSTASGPGITPGTVCWQRPGFKHNKQHFDPSQTIRLMHRMAVLTKPNGEEEAADLHDIAGDEVLSNLIHHQGKLTYLRQKGVPEETPLISKDLNPYLWKLTNKTI